ncbi:hypothetical protein PMAYCL1PPCAC_05719 [Pristionchus mayeri]|uniref:EGF-like domain-containing protein n=1 Tax=Pristionchus mayeri TaxID=1317129 RepID=A0AAN5CB15_9BILA|nr:hypothetical protein PMAYCL1PPCAC_05719 [Pristionchus mayeri]
MWTLLLLLSSSATTMALPTSRGNTCESLANCNGHGTCAVFDGDGDIYCFCDDDWVGTRCQIAKDKWLNGTQDDPCEAVIDCNDHGVCSGRGETVQCNCNPGWYGVRCQIPEDQNPATTTTKKPTTKESERECDTNIECNGHGSCYGTNYEWECECYSGYSGVNCEIKQLIR